MSTFANDFSMPAADLRSCDAASWSIGGLRHSKLVLGLGIEVKQETQAYTNPT